MTLVVFLAGVLDSTGDSQRVGLRASESKVAFRLPLEGL